MSREECTEDVKGKNFSGSHVVKDLKSNFIDLIFSTPVFYISKTDRLLPTAVISNLVFVAIQKRIILSFYVGYRLIIPILGFQDDETSIMSFRGRPFSNIDQFPCTAAYFIFNLELSE